jgi:hypothetical protein
MLYSLVTEKTLYNKVPTNLLVLEKFKVTHVVQKFIPSYGTGKSIVMFTIRIVMEGEHKLCP